MLTVAWSFYDRILGLRPWRGYQSRFPRSIPATCRKTVSDQKTQRRRSLCHARISKALRRDLEAAEDATKTQDDEIAKQIDLLDASAPPDDAFKTLAGKVGSLTYQL